MSLADYLQAVGLPQYLGDAEDDEPISPQFQSLFTDSADIASTLSDKEITELYTYKVPRESTPRGDKGSLAPDPYDLAKEVFKIPSDLTSLRTTHKDTTEWLWRLNKLVSQLQLQTGVQWLGVYRRVTFPDCEGLVKLAYFGEYSRAIFPLTPEFIEISNNAWVGSNGKAKLIADRNNYDGPYYPGLSDNEKSEICVPIFGINGEIEGIINAESWEVGECILPKVVIPVTKACVDLANTSFATVAPNYE